MGQSLMKLAPGLFWNPILKAMGLALEAEHGRKLLSELSEEIDKERSEESKEKDIGSTIGECYDKYFPSTKKDWNFADFYQAVCQTVEDINTKLNSTQFCIPDGKKLQEVYQDHFHSKEKPLKKGEFQKIMQELIISTRFTGFGSKDILLYIFGIPAAAFFIKQRVAPKAVPDEVFIPGVTSATVFLLAKLHKI